VTGMTTLISGGDQGRCGGRNHGAGKQQAIENTRELAQGWIEQARANGQDVTHVELAMDVMHEPLFGRER
jgi:hypothetical protein